MSKLWVDGAVDEGGAAPESVDVTLPVDEAEPETEEPEEEPFVEAGGAEERVEEVGRRRHFFCVRFWERFLATLLAAWASGFDASRADNLWCEEPGERATL